MFEVEWIPGTTDKYIFIYKYKYFAMPNLKDVGITMVNILCFLRHGSISTDRLQR